MRTKANKKLIDDSIKSMIRRLEKTEKFVLEQVPDVAKEMIIESKMENQRDLVASLIGSVVCFAITSVGIYYTIQLKEEVSFLCGAFSVGFLIAGITGIFNSYDKFSQLMFVKKCPKLFLLRSFRRLLK